LRSVFDQLPGRPARGRDPATQLGEVLIGNVDMERTDVDGGPDSGTHLDLHGSRMRFPNDLLSGSGTWARAYSLTAAPGRTTPTPADRTVNHDVRRVARPKV